MSEEFSFTATFNMESAEHMKAFEEMLEHLEMYEREEAEAIMQQYQAASAQQRISELTSPYSSYNEHSNLAKMYIDTYDDNHCDAEFKIYKSRRKGKITLEGYDHDADDVCAALVLLLVAMGASSIQASGGSGQWFACYQTDARGQLTLTFETEND